MEVVKGLLPWTYTVVHLVKHGFNLAVPYFCSAPEAQEQRAACLWFMVHQPNLETALK